LIRINENLDLLINRVYANKKYLGFTNGFKRLERIRAEYKDAYGTRNPQNAAKHELAPAQEALRDEFTDSVRTNLSVSASTVRTAMENAGLSEPFSALLETYVVPFSSTGTDAVPSALNSTNQSSQTFAAGFLSFESDHYRTINGFGEVSIGGRIGVSPTETLVTLSNAPTVPRAYLQNAFSWDLNVRGTTRMGSSVLLAGLFTFGQNILLSNSSVVTPGTSSILPVTTSPYGDTQTAAWFYEIGPEIRIYPYRLQRVASEKKFLLPSFSFATGFRVDDRFTSLSQVTQQQLRSFNRPGQRWFLKSFVTLTKVFERNQSQKSNSNLFNIGIGYEYNSVWGFSGSNRLVVPPNSRIYINASIDLVKAFTKQLPQ
jgi:hypothetical protein